MEKWRASDPSAIPSSKAVTVAPLVEIATMTRIRIQHHYPCKRKHPEPLEAYPDRGLMQTRNAVASMTAKRAVFVFGMACFT
jgi:hypothetical protein